MNTLFLGKVRADRFHFDTIQRKEPNQPPALPFNINKWVPDRINYQILDLTKLLNPDGFGTAYFNFRTTYSDYQDQKESLSRVSAVQVTDLGITARVAYNRVLVWVNSLSSGKPIVGATVELRQDATRLLRTEPLTKTVLFRSHCKMVSSIGFFPQTIMTNTTCWFQPIKEVIGQI